MRNVIYRDFTKNRTDSFAEADRYFKEGNDNWKPSESNIVILQYERVMKKLKIKEN